jgi:quercetin dioxygenase-like cupin family protein
MIIKSIVEELKSATHPVAKALHKGTNFKVLVIGFNEGMVLKDHKAHIPSKLTVIKGNVLYREDGKETVMHLYDEVEIPVDIIHSVSAIEDSLCILTQG